MVQSHSVHLPLGALLSPSTMCGTGVDLAAFELAAPARGKSESAWFDRQEGKSCGTPWIPDLAKAKMNLCHCRHGPSRLVTHITDADFDCKVRCCCA